METPDIELFDQRISTHERALSSVVDRVRAVRLFHAYSWPWNSERRDGQSKGVHLNLTKAIHTIARSRSAGLIHGVFEIAALAVEVQGLALLIADCAPLDDALRMLTISAKRGARLHDVARAVLSVPSRARIHYCYAAQPSEVLDLGSDPLFDHLSEALPGGRYQLKWHKRESTRKADRLRRWVADS